MECKLNLCSELKIPIDPTASLLCNSGYMCNFPLCMSLSLSLCVCFVSAWERVFSFLRIDAVLRQTKKFPLCLCQTEHSNLFDRRAALFQYKSTLPLCGCWFMVFSVTTTLWGHFEKYETFYWSEILPFNDNSGNILITNC